MVENKFNLDTSEKLIKEAIKELYIEPRDSVRKWSKITNQTCQIRFAYPGQHLASLITSTKGSGTAARGDDLADGSEVKTCSRADQLSQCKDCGYKVLVWQKSCPKCKSSNIDIKTDSHWIFSIKSKSELDILLNKVPRIILILFDKENEDSDNIRLRAWIINPKEEYVIKFFTDYFENNYEKKTDPAPCNLHPLLRDFYMMRPYLIFYAEIDMDKKDTNIKFWDLDKKEIEQMPSHLLTVEEIMQIFPYEKVPKKRSALRKADLIEIFPLVPIEKIELLSMKKKVTRTYKEEYKRR